MKEGRAQEIRRKLAVFGQGKLQDLVTLYDLLQGTDIGLEDVKSYLEYTRELFRQQSLKEKKILEERQKKWNRGTRRCPTCEAPLVARAITIERGKGNVKGYTCHWFCQQEDCVFEEYTHEDFKEVYKKIMGGR